MLHQSPVVPDTSATDTSLSNVMAAQLTLSAPLSVQPTSPSAPRNIITDLTIPYSGHRTLFTISSGCDYFEPEAVAANGNVIDMDEVYISDEDDNISTTDLSTIPGSVLGSKWTSDPPASDAGQTLCDVGNSPRLGNPASHNSSHLDLAFSSRPSASMATSRQVCAVENCPQLGNSAHPGNAPLPGISTARQSADGDSAPYPNQSTSVNADQPPYAASRAAHAVGNRLGIPTVRHTTKPDSVPALKPPPLMSINVLPPATSRSAHSVGNPAPPAIPATRPPGFLPSQPPPGAAFSSGISVPYAGIDLAEIGSLLAENPPLTEQVAALIVKQYPLYAADPIKLRFAVYNELRLLKKLSAEQQRPPPLTAYALPPISEGGAQLRGDAPAMGDAASALLAPDVATWERDSVPAHSGGEISSGRNSDGRLKRPPPVGGGQSSAMTTVGGHPSAWNVGASKSVFAGNRKSADAVPALQNPILDGPRGTFGDILDTFAEVTSSRGEFEVAARRVHFCGLVVYCVLNLEWIMLEFTCFFVRNYGPGIKSENINPALVRNWVGLGLMWLGLQFYG